MSNSRDVVVHMDAIGEIGREDRDRPASIPSPPQPLSTFCSRPSIRTHFPIGMIADSEAKWTSEEPHCIMADRLPRIEEVLAPEPTEDGQCINTMYHSPRSRNLSFITHTLCLFFILSLLIFSPLP